MMSTEDSNQFPAFDAQDFDDYQEPAGELIEQEPESCEHGLSAWLCTGPNHYPADNQF